VAEIEAQLGRLERKHAGRIRFTGGDLVRTAEEAESWARGVGDVDAVLLFILSAPAGPLAQAIAPLQAPVLLFQRPYAGHSWAWASAQQQAGRKIDVVATSDFSAFDPYVPVFRTIHHLRKSKVLVVAPNPGTKQVAAGFTKQFGTEMCFLTYEDLKAAYEAADPRKAVEAAGELIRGAVRTVEPSRDEVRDAMRFYLGILDLLGRENANAIAVDCFHGFSTGLLPAHPCIAWAKLNDRGMYGVCEADLHSTMTQLLVTSATGKPGFISDPVWETGRNEVIHAHCVAATAMQGVGGPASPYILRSHLETNRGATLQVLVPVKERITVAKFSGPAQFLVSTAEVIENVDSPRGCRTQFRTRVSDARKLLEGYSGGLHRVIFYGDHVAAAERMGRLMGFKVVREI
jgi:L-fucose isomerase-like protein